MNSEERRVLTQFLDQLAAAKGVSRDPDADGLIREAVAKQPDAAYLLVQKALLQEQALSSAKARIGELQNQLEQSRTATKPARGGSFLGGDPWAAPARPAAPAAGAWPPAAPAAGFGGGMGSFLGTAAATAAGIAGGAFLFQGIESLLGHHGGGSFLGSNDLGHDPIENVTINEYYGSDPTQQDDEADDLDFQDADFRPEEDFYGDLGDDDSIDV